MGWFILFVIFSFCALLVWHDQSMTKWLEKKEFYPIDRIFEVERIVPGETFFVPVDKEGLRAENVHVGSALRVERSDGSVVTLVGHLWMGLTPLWAVKEVLPPPPEPEESEDFPPCSGTVLSMTSFRRKKNEANKQEASDGDL